VLVVALVATALLAPAASSKTVTARNVVSADERISCLAVVDSTEIECFATFLPEIGELDTYMALRPRGRARQAERGDFPGSGSPSRTLRNGDRWKRPGVRCALRRGGLTCRNRDDHGFRLVKGGIRRF
jgi:hypothetical protein